MCRLVKCAIFVSAATVAFSYDFSEDDIVFHLFTRASPDKSEALLPSLRSIMTSSFSVSRGTLVTIHSNGETISGNFNAIIVPAHLSAEDINIIAVDWSPGSRVYTEGLAYAPQCGKVIAKFINIIIRYFGYDPNLIRIVGIGLGGHIAGIAARNVDGEVPHITALDPSLFGWTHHPEKLTPADASIVEVLHTTAGDFGYDYPIGDLDFYPNGGRSQLGCGANSSCSHTRASEIYTESITAEKNQNNEFVGTACESYKHAITMACSGHRDTIFGGTKIKLFESGIFTFFTHDAPPFAVG